MRSRILITAVLVAGALVIDAGAAYATSALSVAGDAASAQYGNVQEQQPVLVPTPPPPPAAAVLSTSPTVGSGTSPAETAGIRPASDTSPTPAGDVAAARTPTVATAQTPRQLEVSGSGKLPFTGYAAISVLLAGLALLGGGLALRRGARTAPTGS